MLALPDCVLGIRCTEDDLLAEIVFLPPDTALSSPSSPLAERFIDEVSHYLADARHRPDLPQSLRGTPFQNRVWRLIDHIPAGKTLTYGEVAHALNSSPRAVGQACGANPFPLITPCHRVLARSGLGGFARHSTDWLLRTKQWLLAHEKQT